MKQLEMRFYNRQELAAELSVNITKNIKRDIENRLNKWGYSYNYSRKGWEITQVPQTAKERLTEILLREYGLDVQIDLMAFTYFLIAFQEIEAFYAMPWEERAKSLKEFYGVNVSDKTLRSWCSKLINVGSMAKIDGVNIYWNTYINAMGEKVRALVDGDEELEQELAQYKADRNELLKTMNWGEANKVLWSRYGSCFYSCKAIGLSAFDDIGKLQEIYELAEEIIQ